VTRRNIFAAIFFLFFSLYICFESLRIGFGSWHKPGPGFLAFWSGIVLGCLALVTMFENGKANEGSESSAQVSWRGRVSCFLALLAYVVLLNPLGFLLTTFLFITFLVKVVEGRGWGAAMLMGSAMALGSYGLFELCLKSQLPMGILKLFGL
jgi:putative tricarboxylic transport membrane protein